MDGVQYFFAKYHAVPANNAGAQWDKASVDSLLGWLNGECDLIRRGTGDPKRAILREVLAEVWSRIGALSKECAKQPADWHGRNTVGRLLAAIAMNADVLTLSIREG